ncbi:MAG: HlyD family efflux transporter periplasmic adaptor subunit [Synechococcaceae cyanobacterium]|nr:HlyD family efflux transporter periplasmic adaptor subunit [Synechococcaceae cyanobacterium]
MSSAESSLLWRLYGCLPVALVAGLSLVWAASPSVPVQVMGMGVLQPPEARRGFFARAAGEVQALLVRPDQAVRQGQLLVTLSRVSQNAAGGGLGEPGSPQVTSARLAAVSAQLRTLAVQNAAFDDRRQALLSRREQISTTNRPVASQLAALEGLRKDDVIARYSPLWVGAQDLWLRNRAEISAVDAQLAELRAQRAALNSQAAELQAQRAALQSQELGQEVFSPVSGRVLDVAVQPGQPVLPGQKLGSIATDASRRRHQAVVLFTAADSTRLAVGDEVKLNPQLLSRDSYGSAEQRYGLVPGRLVSLSRQSIELADVAAVVGSQEEAANLMASARQRSYGEGGDLTGELPGRTGAPLVMAVVQLEPAPTPSGLAWTRGQGPSGRLPGRTPAEVKAEVEMRSVLSYVAPFWRWISGSRA